MPIAYYLVPYQPHPTWPRARVCAMDDHTQEIEAAGGAWSESEIVGDRAVVRVRASDTLLNQLGLLYPRLSETEAAAALKLGRAKPRYDAATDRIVFAPIADQPAKPLDVLVREIPETPPSQEFLTLLGLWMAVGFGEGWRLPWAEIIKGALSGLPPLWGAAFPTTSVLDNFNRANEGPPPSASWSQSWLGNGFKVVTNQAAPNVDGSNNGDYWNVSTFGPDSEIFATIASIPTTNWFRYFELQLRLANPTNSAAVDGYVYALEGSGTGVPDQNKKFRLDNGAYTQLGATVTQQYGAGDQMGLEMIGSSLQMYRQPSGGAWGTLGTASTDSTYSAAGYIGIGSDSTVLRIDDFGGGTVVTAGATFAAVLEGSSTVQAAVTTQIMVSSVVEASAALLTALTTQITVASALEASAALQSDVTTQIALAALAEGSGTLTAALTTDITAQTALEASASVTAALADSAAGATFAVALEGSGTVGSSLTTEIACAAALDGAATLQSAITTQIMLASSLEASAALQAAITTEIVTAAVLAASVDLAAELATEILVASALDASAALLADLTVVAPLRAAVSAAGELQAELTTSVLLAAGVEADLALASELLTAIELEAAPAVEARLAAELTTAVQMAATLAAESVLAADLRTGEALRNEVLATAVFARTLQTERAFARTVAHELMLARAVPREVEF